MTPEHSTEIKLTELTPESLPAYVNQIAELHQASFPGGILSQLGRDFVYDYYRNVANSPEGHLWVSTSQNEVMGYLACTTNRERFEREHRAGAAKRAMIYRLLTFRLSPMSVARGLKKRKLAEGLSDRAELLAIAVAPPYRRMKVGTQLIQLWIQTLRQAGLDHYLVFTDNEDGYHFYRRAGGECLFEFRLRGHVSAAFRMRT